MKKHTSKVTTGEAGNRHSLRDGFTAYSVLSLVNGLCCHHPRCKCVSIVTWLMPASRHRDHTASSSASLRVRRSQGKNVHRIPHSTLVTIA
jgi:hypothetical protein